MRSFGDGSQQIEFPRAQSPIETILLEGATQTISSIIEIPRHELVAVASQDNLIRVYSLYTSGAPKVIFQEHIDQVRGLEHLEDDIVVSVADDRTVVTWQATSGKMLDSAHIENWALSVARIDSQRFVVGTTEGELIIFWHENGRNLKQIRYLFKATTDWVFQISIRENLALSCSHNKIVTIWNTKTWKRISLLRHEEWVKCVALSEKYIIAGCYNGKLYVYNNTPKFAQCCVFNSNLRIQAIQFINPTTLVVCGVSGNIRIISISEKQGIAEIPVKLPKNVWSMKVLNSGQIVLGGKDGTTSLISAPPTIESVLHNVSVDPVNVVDQQFETNAIDGSNEEHDEFILGSTVTSEESQLDNRMLIAVPTSISEPHRSCCMHAELDRWKSMRFNRRNVIKLNTRESAEFLAAFLIKFNAKRSENYVRIRNYLIALFEHNFVDGDLLLGLARRRKRRQAKRLRTKILAAVIEAEGVGKRLGLEYRLDLFLDRLREIELRSQASVCISLFSCFTPQRLLLK